MTNAFILPEGSCLVHEFDNNILVLSLIVPLPVTPESLLGPAKALYEQGFRKFSIIAVVGSEYKGFACVDDWRGGKYAPHSPTWETLTLAQVEALIGCELVLKEPSIKKEWSDMGDEQKWEVY